MIKARAVPYSWKDVFIEPAMRLAIFAPTLSGSGSFEDHPLALIPAVVIGLPAGIYLYRRLLAVYHEAIAKQWATIKKHRPKQGPSWWERNREAFVRDFIVAIIAGTILILIGVVIGKNT